MKIIENGNKTYTKFRNLIYNDVFRSKKSSDIYIKVFPITNEYQDDFNAWSLTSESFAFFGAEEEVEALEAELHIKS